MTGVDYTPVMHSLTLSGEKKSVVLRRVRIADRLLARYRARALDRALAGGESPDASVALGLRARFLISRRCRDQLGQTLQRIVRERGRSPSIARARLNAEGIDAAAAALAELAGRLLASGPVEARGIAQVRLLLSDGTGPMFRRRCGDDLRPRVNAAIASLDPAPSPSG
jgi:hypothetical protein